MEGVSQLENKDYNLERLTEKAIIWAQEQSHIILETGTSLSASEVELAKVVSVEHPELVRVIEVDTIPAPSDPEIKSIVESTGLFGPNIAGITFGYGIYIKKNQRNNRLMSHELRHVYQYEQAGSVRNFLLNYIHELLSVGYANAPLELDAKNHEQKT